MWAKATHGPGNWVSGLCALLPCPILFLCLCHHRLHQLCPELPTLQTTGESNSTRRTPAGIWATFPKGHLLFHLPFTNELRQSWGIFQDSSGTDISFHYQLLWGHKLFLIWWGAGGAHPEEAAQRGRDPFGTGQQAASRQDSALPLNFIQMKARSLENSNCLKVAAVSRMKRQGKTQGPLWQTKITRAH